MAFELYKRKIKYFFVSLFTLLILAIIVIVISLSVGPAMLNPKDVFKAIFLKSFYSDVDPTIYSISMLRLSRTMASFFCGAALSLAGLLMQTITRNPLADPYIFGLSSTALTSIAIAVIVSPSFAVYRYNLVLVAFIGALTGYVITVSLAKLAGGDSLALVLAGVAVASLFSGVSHILLYVVQNIIRTPYVYFLMGSTSTVLLKDLNFLFYPTLLLLLIAIVFFKPLNAYLYGDDYAKQLGFNPKRIIFIAATIASILTAITVAFIGIVGFIGLAAPHIARFFVGSDHRFSIPITTLVGGIITTIADIVVRLISMFARGIGELPLGVITSVIGAPFLAYLIIRRSRA